jgi:hypothetical protein
MQYILLDLVYFGGFSFISHGRKGSNHLKKDDHCLIYINKFVKGVFHSITRLFSIKEEGFQACEHYL